jgi:hypothetical protein
MGFNLAIYTVLRIVSLLFLHLIVNSMTPSLKPFEQERFPRKLLLSKISSPQPYDCSQNVSSMRSPYNLHQSIQWYLQHVSPYPAFPRTKRDFNIFALDACRANIIRSKKASIGVSLLSLRPNIRPIYKALPAELMVTLRAYQKYSANGPRK